MCSGNSNYFEVSPFIKVQAASIENLGHHVDFYLIKGKGIFGYIKNILPLKDKMESTPYDVVHAHYSLCAIVAFIAAVNIKYSIVIKSIRTRLSHQPSRKIQLISSLLGSDVNGSCLWRIIIRVFVQFFWTETIVKSPEMKSKLGVSKIHVLPNGIDIETFKELDKVECRKILGLSNDVKYILFAAAPERRVKNYQLAKSAFDLIRTPNSKLLTLGRVPHHLIPFYLNASDVLILTSLWEGSPNIIKEAMSCNCQIVSTDVGDVSWLFGNLTGLFLTTNIPKDIAAKIDIALNYEGNKDGRKRIVELGLDARTVASRLVKIYENV